MRVAPLTIPVAFALGCLLVRRSYPNLARGLLPLCAHFGLEETGEEKSKINSWFLYRLSQFCVAEISSFKQRVTRIGSDHFIALFEPSDCFFSSSVLVVY